MSTANPPGNAWTKNPLVRVVLIVCGIAGMITGARQMYEGVNEIRGAGESAAATQRIKESDQAVDEANAITQAAAMPFQALLDAVDNTGLEAARKQHGEAAQKLIADFAAAATKARLGAAKLTEAEQHGVNENFKPFIDTKAKSYEAFAVACDKNQALVKLLMDESFAKLDDVLPKFNVVVAERDAAQKQANELTEQANKLVPQTKPAENK
ncbi:MAG: hypothetical protein JNM18_11005 [Planctomycetaceae bacterium]|nr:hypothetical protein [Planctomycetaceae bacterium]